MKWENVQDNSTSFLFYMPLPVDGWSLALFFPVDEVLESVNDLARNTLLIGLIGFLLFAGVIVLVTRRITRPIHDLSKAALEIAGGNLQAELPKTTSRDEVGKLSESFGLMQQSLQEYIANLETTTRQKERIESELRIAHDIQMSILPKIFPPFPDHDEFEIFASLEPAREVGGDLYDFFFIDEHRFCFLVGDVSGKGVPAAFLMAVTKTLLKVVAERGINSGEILEKVNNDLAEDNDSCMFVTLFLAILDLRTGILSYSSAGHNPPVLMTTEQTTFIAPINEPIAGAMPGMKYTTHSITLAYGDMLFLYTDGVTEAMNEQQDLYTDERLLEFLDTTDAAQPEPVIDAVNSSIHSFAGTAEQSDDITMLAMKYKGGSSMKNGDE
jgi:sigma-B regulation protein RsbU (phosphoserine phosphatase)